MKLNLHSVVVVSSSSSDNDSAPERDTVNGRLKDSYLNHNGLAK